MLVLWVYNTDSMDTDIKKLTDELKRMALPHGLCTGWQEMLDDVTDKEILVRMYLRGIDFCLSNDYPSVGYMEKHFKGMCERMGVYVNEPVYVSNLRKVVAVGSCIGTVNYQNYAVGQVFIKHSSHLNIIAETYSNVTIDCFDDVVVNIQARTGAVVTVCRYEGATVKLECDPDAHVKVIAKKKKTY